MRNLVLIFTTLLCVYLYAHPRVETRVAPARPVLAAARPVPTAAPTYYHSPLDAGAMSTSASTGTGYFSTDPESRFRNIYYGGYSGPAAGGYYGSAYGGYPVYGGGGGTVSNTAIYNINTGGTAASSVRSSTPPHVYLGRYPTQPPNSSGTGR